MLYAQLKESLNKSITNKEKVYYEAVRRDSAVRIATGYGLDD
jgi:hypothetical protein